MSSSIFVAGKKAAKSPIHRTSYPFQLTLMKSFVDVSRSRGRFFKRAPWPPEARKPLHWFSRKNGGRLTRGRFIRNWKKQGPSRTGLMSTN